MDGYGMPAGDQQRLSFQTLNKASNWTVFVQAQSGGDVSGNIGVWQKGHQLCSTYSKKQRVFVGRRGGGGGLVIICREAFFLVENPRACYILGVYANLLFHRLFAPWSCSTFFLPKLSENDRLLDMKVVVSRLLPYT